ncbi:MAG: hypothetical protein ACYDCL_14570 [Myxococcales bacterium]
MRLGIAIALAAAAAACLGSRPENRRAKERIFSAHPETLVPPDRVPIDLAALPASAEVQDHALEMGEAEAAARLGSFRLRGTLAMDFDGRARDRGQLVSLTEERLVEQAASGDLHLRLLESGGGGMELVLAQGRLYGRSRYGPFVERDPAEDLDRYRDEVFGALATLYRDGNRAWKLSPMNLETVGGRSCQRFDVTRGADRPTEGQEAFEGRLDPDSQKHFEFLYGRELDDARGSICLDRENGVPLQAKVELRWSASGDAGVVRVHAVLSETVDRVGQNVAVASPADALPEPHRPRGQAAALERYGFLERSDGGLLAPPAAAAAPKN